MRPRVQRGRRGFTLLETMIAVALVGMVTLGALTLFEQVQETDRLITRDAAAADMQRNSERLIQQLFRSAESSVDSTSRFIGDEGSAQITTWCPAPGGWLERCRVLVLIDRSNDSTAIVAQLSNAEAIATAKRLGVGEFRYLNRTAHDTVWLSSWGQSIVVPDAAALIVGGDTLVFPIGAGNG